MIARSTLPERPIRMSAAPTLLRTEAKRDGFMVAADAGMLVQRPSQEMEGLTVGVGFYS
jgi:hypothetical protein